MFATCWPANATHRSSACGGSFAPRRCRLKHTSAGAFSFAVRLLYLLRRVSFHPSQGRRCFMRTTVRYTTAVAARTGSTDPCRHLPPRRGTRAVVLCASGLIAVFHVVPRAHADSTPAATSEGGLTEIVVTAEKVKST